MKDNTTADEFRNEGNAFFQRSKFYEALISYNKSLCHAMPKSSQLGLAYANRSAVYLELKQFDKCLGNIQLARDNKYPNEVKLKEREGKCKKQLKTQQPDPKNNPWTYFKLSYPTNEKIPFIVDCLDLRTDEKYGRHIITNRNLKAGDVIAIEEPHFHSLYKNAWYSKCTFCQKSNMLNLIPCSNENDPSVCCSAMYCDQECSTKARVRYHGAYCKFIETIFAGRPENSFDTLTPVSKRFLESLFVAKDPLALKDLMSSNKQKTIFDYDLSNQTSDPAADFKYLSIFNNLEMDSNKQRESLFRRDSSLVMEYFPRLNSLCSQFPKLKPLFVEYSTRLALIAHRNGFSVYSRGQRVGKAILPFGNLYSHSCVENIGLAVVDNKFVHIVVKPIKKGEQVFMNYGFNFTKKYPDRVERQKAIQESYNFTCSCAACLNNWSMNSLPIHYDPNFVPFSEDLLPDTVENTMTKLIKHFDYINKNFKNYPSYEIQFLVERCHFLLKTIEKHSAWPF